MPITDLDKRRLRARERHRQRYAERSARRRAAGIPRHRDPAKARAAERERYQRRTEERIQKGLCPKCGRSEPEPERTLCRSCGEQRRRYERTRYAEGMAAGKLYAGKSAEAKRRSVRRRCRRRRRQRKADGLCVRCGHAPPVPGGASCEPCLEKRRAVVEACRRPRKNSAARRRYAERRKRWLCTACGRPSGGASRCEPCARRSWARSEHARGLPLYPPGCTVVDAVAGDTLEAFESWEDAVLFLSFEGIQIEDVELLVDRSPMATLTAAPWE